MPSLAVMQRLAGKGFGAKTAVIPSIRGLVELLSGNETEMLRVVLQVDTDREWYGLVQAVVKIPYCLR